MTLRTQRLSVAAYFLLSGFGLASAYMRLPDIKHALGLDEGTLGVALLGPAAGALIALPLTGLLIARMGSRGPTILAALVYGAALALVGLTGSLLALMAALAVVGAANGMLDVAMNDQAARVEGAYGRPIMSSFHGVFSLGGLLGAGAGGLAAAFRIPVSVHFGLLAVLLVAMAVLATSGLRPGRFPGAASTASGGKRPFAALLPLCVIAFCCLLGEGAVADWSAVYLRDHLGAGPGLAAGGYAAFALAMTVARFAGDGVTARMGPSTLIFGGGAVVALGLTTGLVIGETWAMILGFGAVGLGLAGMIPVVFSAAARIGEPGPSIAAVSTVGYTGFLVGPPAIGFLAEATSLTLSLGLVGALALVAAVLAPAVRRPTPAPVAQAA